MEGRLGQVGTAVLELEEVNLKQFQRYSGLGYD